MCPFFYMKKQTGKNNKQVQGSRENLKRLTNKKSKKGGSRK